VYPRLKALGIQYVGKFGGISADVTEEGYEKGEKEMGENVKEKEKRKIRVKLNGK
jgi:hypothetical protein